MMAQHPCVVAALEFPGGDPDGFGGSLLGGWQDTGDIADDVGMLLDRSQLVAFAGSPLHGSPWAISEGSIIEERPSGEILPSVSAEDVSAITADMERRQAIW